MADQETSGKKKGSKEQSSEEELRKFIEKKKIQNNALKKIIDRLNSKDKE